MQYAENALTSFDKLKDVKPVGSFFDFRCPNCKNTGIELSPVDVAWRPEGVSFEDLGKSAYHFKELPTLPEAICIASVGGGRIMFECSKCCCTKVFNSNFVNGVKLREWVKKKYGVTVLTDKVNGSGVTHVE